MVRSVSFTRPKVHASAKQRIGKESRTSESNPQRSPAKVEESSNIQSSWIVPPLSALVKGDDVVGDVTWLLDFAIVGFPKCGTTTISRNLESVASLLVGERFDLVTNKTADLVESLYMELPLGGNTKRGMKCPQDISSDNSLPNYARHFNRTNLIIGIRHPVLWFQSFYNFRVRNQPYKEMLHTDKLTRRCVAGSQGICAWRANFHDFMSRLGKTPRSMEEEHLLSLHLPPVPSPVGRVFLYELDQLGDSDAYRKAAFREDLRQFLGIEQQLPDMPHINTIGKLDFHPRLKRVGLKKMIDICEDQHLNIRTILMDKARRTSRWVLRFFLQSDEVTVSSREYLVELLKKWELDPCTNETYREQVPI